MLNKKGIVLMETLLFLMLIGVCIALLTACVYSYQRSNQLPIYSEERIKAIYEEN